MNRRESFIWLGILASAPLLAKANYTKHSDEVLIMKNKNNEVGVLMFSVKDYARIKNELQKIYSSPDSKLFYDGEMKFCQLKDIAYENISFIEVYTPTDNSSRINPKDIKFIWEKQA